LITLSRIIASNNRAGRQHGLNVTLTKDKYGQHYSATLACIIARYAIKFFFLIYNCCKPALTDRSPGIVTARFMFASSLQHLLYRVVVNIAQVTLLIH